MIDEVINDLKSLKTFLEEKQLTGAYMDGSRNEKSQNNPVLEPISIDQLKNEINILSCIKNKLMEFQIRTPPSGRSASTMTRPTLSP